MAKYTNLNIAEFEEKIQNDPNAVVLDVRTPLEYRGGHLKMAQNVPNIREEHEGLDKNKNYYVHCRVGGRSAVASQLLAMNGFENVYNLNDKIENTSLELIKEKVSS